MHFKYLALTGILLVLLDNLAACGSGISESTATPNGTVKAIESKSPTANIIGSVSLQPLSPTSTLPPQAATSFPILPTPLPLVPDARDFNFAEFFFDDTIVPNCELPCWRGLIIGRSKADNVKYLFDNTFGVEGARNVGLGVLKLRAANKDQNTISYLWTIEPIGIGAFAVRTRLAQDGGRLQLMMFYWEMGDSSKLEIRMTPVDVVKRLGAPSHLLASANLQGGASSGTIALLMIYDQGVVFEFTRQIPTRIVFKDAVHKDVDSVFLDLCLADTIAIPGETFLTGNVYLMPAFLDGLNQMLPIQQELVASSITRNSLEPIENVFQIDSNQFSELALTRLDPCLHSKNLAQQLN